MEKEIKTKINVKGSEIMIISILGQNDDFISITGIAKNRCFAILCG